MKKVAIIGTVGIPSRYGGFETLAHHLTDQLQDEFEFTVYCSKKAYQPNERLTHFNGARLNLRNHLSQHVNSSSFIRLLN